jgi:hypothetical protein
MTAPAKTPLNLVCVRQNFDQMIESHFIRDVILGGVPRPIRVFTPDPGDAIPIGDNILVFAFEDGMQSFIREALDRKVKNLGIYHGADELLTAKKWYYNDVDYVIRNYYIDGGYPLRPDARCLDVQWVPNGYRTGVGPRRSDTLVPFSARIHEMFFSGYLDSSEPVRIERSEMFDVVERHKLPAKLMKSSGFAQGLGVPSYCGYMENTRFALAPRGRAVESIRLYDALELGCVPITLNHPFISNLMSDAPFVILKSWQDLPAWYAAEIKRPNFLQYWDQRQQQIIEWWETQKRFYRTAAATLIERSFARAEGLALPKGI